MSTNTQALARKWRPRQFSELIGQQHIVTALSNALNSQHLHHAYLFTGTRGVGKTTLARIVAKSLNCEQGISATPCDQCSNCQELNAGHFPDLFEIDAASRTKVEDTRQILDNVQYSPIKGRYKIYLIDEVHMLSGHSFNALLKTLEEPPEHVKFLLATTDPQKLPATVLSRCLQFHLQNMPPEDIHSHLSTICTQESIAFDDQALGLLAKAANGSMRDGLSLLDQNSALGNGEVTLADTQTMLGSIDQQTIIAILNALSTEDAHAVLQKTALLQQQGANFKSALAEILTQLHHISIIQLVPEQHDHTQPELSTLAEALSREQVQLYYQIGLLGQRDLALAPSLLIGFEMTLLRMLSFSPQVRATTQSKPQNNRKHAPHTISPQVRVATQSETQNNRTHTPNTISTAVTSAELNLEQLAVSGTTSALIQACSLSQLTENTLKLNLSKKFSALLNDQHVKKISTAATELLGRPIKAEIIIAETHQPTTAEIQKNKAGILKNKAKNSLKSDKNVQNMIKNFDATLIHDTIAESDDK